MSFKFKVFVNGIIYEAFDNTETHYLLQYYNKKPCYQPYTKKELHKELDRRGFILVEGEVTNNGH